MSQVYVYRNLRAKCWSIMDLKTKRVVGHAQSLRLKKAEFKVSEAGRQRVLRQKRKNVHAGVIGEIEPNQVLCVTPVKYNPYIRGEFFIPFRGESAIMTADCVEFTDKGKVFAKL